MDVESAVDIEVGKEYRTLGGWKAKVVWRLGNNLLGSTVDCFIVIHRPEAPDEKQGYCTGSGKAYSTLAIDEPPAYGQHPANIVEEWSE